MKTQKAKLKMTNEKGKNQVLSAELQFCFSMIEF
jgi:hypothetical protein